MADPTLKRCSKCALEKPPADFRVDKQKPDGRYSSCRECCKAKERARYASDPEFRKWCANYRYRNPEAARRNEVRQRTVNREALKKRKREYQKKAAQNPEFQKKWADYRARTADKIEERRKRWRDKNPERVKELSKGYSHLRRAARSGGVPAPVFAAWVIEQPKICYWCDVKCADDFHVDHYVPLSKGGPHELHNLVIACAPCNLKKNAKDPIKFAHEKGKLF